MTVEGLLLHGLQFQRGAIGYGEEKGVLTKPGTWITYRSVFTPLATVCPQKTLDLQKDEAVRSERLLPTVAICSSCRLALLIPCETLGGTYAFFLLLLMEIRLFSLQREQKRACGPALCCRHRPWCNG